MLGCKYKWTGITNHAAKKIQKMEQNLFQAKYSKNQNFLKNGKKDLS